MVDVNKVKHLDQIPTLSLFYKLNRIPIDDSATRSHPPNAAYNDKISIVNGDITKLATDAIVNAANEALLGGSGVDGAINDAAGDDLKKESGPLGPIKAGEAVITGGYELPAKKVIHAVGPRAYMLDDAVAEEKLRSCYRKGLELAVEHGLKSIAYPAISTGIFCYNNIKACNHVLSEVRKFFDEGKGDGIERVVFCNFLQKDQDIYLKTVAKYFPPVPEAEKQDESNVETDEADVASKLPDAPTTEPTNPEEPSPKKQKTEGWNEVADKEGAKDALKGEL